ncbi:hypothetical protein PtA15_12A454 [Puccinia triticina]|uniref:Shugoshin C-terminal domain-containing protein n=1 Tax=Puccinia triticina TaxID=208348 RepID=A0ABY7D0N2_9BASI|nr:uncharacterized protein PtA15_12A454 [Puccinia triticina]WAQ90465.1 hypothetical protein PtA15_12A454 [Puccinia triticina]
MGHQTSHSRSWKPPSLKNAKSFLIKLVHLHPTAPHKADEPPPDDQAPHGELQQEGPQDDRTNSLPPAYEVAVQTPSHLPGHGQIESSHDLQEPTGSLQESLSSSSIMRESVVMEDTSVVMEDTSVVMEDTSGTSSSASSSTNLPSSAIQSTSLMPTPHNREEIESLADRRLLRPSSSRQSYSSNNPRPSKRRFTKASSISTLNSHRNAHDGRSGSRRDRELIAAKKSLPILTKFGKPSTSYKNAPLL